MNEIINNTTNKLKYIILSLLIIVVKSYYSSKLKKTNFNDRFRSLNFTMN